MGCNLGKRAARPVPGLVEPRAKGTPAADVEHTVSAKVMREIDHVLVVLDGRLAFLLEQGCGIVAGASSRRREEAHGFQTRIGHERPKIRTPGFREMCWPCMRRSTADLDAVIADRRDSPDRLVEGIGGYPAREAGIDPGVECVFECHCCSLRGPGPVRMLPRYCLQPAGAPRSPPCARSSRPRSACLP